MMRDRTVGEREGERSPAHHCGECMCVCVHACVCVRWEETEREEWERESAVFGLLFP